MLKMLLKKVSLQFQNQLSDAARFRLSPSLYLVFSRVRVDFSGMFRKRFFLKLKLAGVVWKAMMPPLLVLSTNERFIRVLFSNTTSPMTGFASMRRKVRKPFAMVLFTMLSLAISLA